MAGLLGDSWGDPKSMAVMQMAAGLLGGGNFGQALGRGLGGYQETMGNAKKAALLEEEMQFKRDERKRAADQRQRESEVERLIREQFMPMSGTQAIQGDALGPTVAKAQNIGQTRPIDYQALSAQQVPFERLKQLADAANLGRAEVARTLETDGPDGSKLIRQLDRWGKDVVPGMPGYVAPVQVNQGDKITIAKPQAGQTFNVGMSPAEQQRVAQGWASNNLARERFEFDQRGGADAVNVGKPQYKDGMWVMPPKDMQPGQTIPVFGSKAESNKQSAIASAGSVRNTVDEALNLVGMNTAGLGSWAAVLPATDARDLSSKLETIKANLGFDRLQQMRDQSPTGGALGAVAVQELTALQSTVSSLDQGQSPSQLRASLKKIDKHYKNMQAVMRGENPYDEKPAAPGQLGSGSFKILSVE